MLPTLRLALARLGGSPEVLAQLDNASQGSQGIPLSRVWQILQNLQNGQGLSDNGAQSGATAQANSSQSAVGGVVPVQEVMRCLMYHRYYGEPELARQTFSGLPGEVRDRLNAVDYSRAEKACPNGLAITELMRQALELLA